MVLAVVACRVHFTAICVLCTKLVFFIEPETFTQLEDAERLSRRNGNVLGALFSPAINPKLALFVTPHAVVPFGTNIVQGNTDTHRYRIKRRITWLSRMPLSERNDIF